MNVDSDGSSVNVPPHLADFVKKSSPNLNETQRKKFVSLILDYEDVFDKPSGDKERCTLIQHRIDRENNIPIKQATRTLPLNGREDINKLVDYMLASDVIKSSSCTWTSSIILLLVKKKDGTERFCIDYKRSNDINKKDSYQLHIR